MSGFWLPPGHSRNFRWFGGGAARRRRAGGGGGGGGSNPLTFPGPGTYRVSTVDARPQVNGYAHQFSMHINPSGTKIAWASMEAQPGFGTTTYAADVWLADANGANPVLAIASNFGGTSGEMVPIASMQIGAGLCWVSDTILGVRYAETTTSSGVASEASRNSTGEYWIYDVSDPLSPSLITTVAVGGYQCETMNYTHGLMGLSQTGATDLRWIDISDWSVTTNVLTISQVKANWGGGGIDGTNGLDHMNWSPNGDKVLFAAKTGGASTHPATCLFDGTTIDAASVNVITDTGFSHHHWATNELVFNAEGGFWPHDGNSYVDLNGNAASNQLPYMRHGTVSVPHNLFAGMDSSDGSGTGNQFVYGNIGDPGSKTVDVTGKIDDWWRAYACFHPTEKVCYYMLRPDASIQTQIYMRVFA